MRDDELIVSRKRMAAILGRSEKTISRRFGHGDIPGGFKVGGRTSPIKITRKSMRKILDGKTRRG